MDLHFLPTLNAVLNATAAVLLMVARGKIKAHYVLEHKRCMLSAVTVSILFLISYLTYHYEHGSQAFQSHGFIRIVYLGILLSHTIFAASLAVLIPLTLFRGLKRMDALHRRVAPWTYWIWMYVSVTGVLIYVLLYHVDRILIRG